MRILYIGKSDTFAAEIVNRYVKEGNSVSIISNKKFDMEIKPKLEYILYEYKGFDLRINNIFKSLKPEIVIYGGEIIGDQEWIYGVESNQYLSELLNVLNLSKNSKIEKFIYLSSVEVYNQADLTLLNELNKKAPSSYKGILCAQGESLVEEFCTLNQINSVILRISDLYGYKLKDLKNDVISLLLLKMNVLENSPLNANRNYSLLAIKDATEAIFRASSNTPSSFYNVSGSQNLNEYELSLKLKQSLGLEIELNSEKGNAYNYSTDTSLIKKELEWHEICSFEDTIKNYANESQNSETEKKKIKEAKTPVKQSIINTVENLMVFAVFAIIISLFKDHSILKNIELLNIYIIIIALFFGIRQSIIAVILSFGLYIFGQNFAFGNMLTIIVNADTFLKLAQYVFMGIVVGYSVDHYKASLKEMEIENEYLVNEFKELTQINNENIVIKHEYEKRLISNKTSLPKLYSITNKLNSLEPEVILSSMVNMIQEVLETDTVAIYSFSKDTGYARLVSSLNDKSVFIGKSFKLSDYKELETKLFENEIFIGNQWSEDNPSIAGSISFNRGNTIALLIIKEMPFDKLNLYQINLFRTLSALISESLRKAYQYEEKIRSEKYIPNTEILKFDEFKKIIQLKENEKQNKISEYTLIRMNYTGAALDYYLLISNAFRTSDYFGIDSNGVLHVILSNTEQTEIEYVKDRLEQRQISFEIVAFETLQEEI